MKSIFLLLISFTVFNLFSQKLPCNCRIGKDTITGQNTYQSFDENDNELTYMLWKGSDTISYITCKYDSKNRMTEKQLIIAGEASNKSFHYSYLKNYKTKKVTFQNGKKIDQSSFKDYYYLYRDRINHIDEKGNHVNFIFKDSTLKEIETRNEKNELIFSVKFIYQNDKLSKEIHLDVQENCIVKEIDYNRYGKESLIIERPFGNFFHVTTEYHLYNDFGIISSTGYLYDGEEPGRYHVEYEKVECLEKIRKENRECEEFVKLFHSKLMGKWSIGDVSSVSIWDNPPDSLVYKEAELSLENESLFKAEEIEFQSDGYCIINKDKKLKYEVTFDPSECNPYDSWSVNLITFRIRLTIGNSLYFFRSSHSTLEKEKNKIPLTLEYPTRSFTKYLIRK